MSYLMACLDILQTVVNPTIYANISAPTKSRFVNDFSYDQYINIVLVLTKWWAKLIGEVSESHENQRERGRRPQALSKADRLITFALELYEMFCKILHAYHNSLNMMTFFCRFMLTGSEQVYSPRNRCNPPSVNGVTDIIHDSTISVY